MYSYILAAKRAWRSVYFPVLLLLLGVSLIAAVFLGTQEELPLAGVCDLDGSITSGRICSYLLDNHFVVCENESDLRDGVASGKWNCGILIPRGFEAMLQAGDIEGAVRFITSPASLYVPLYKNHATAAIFTEHAAVISANALEGTDISREELTETYRALMDEGLLFSFDIAYVEGSADVTDWASTQRARDYVLSVASLLIFVMLTYSVCDLLSRDMRVLPSRVGAKQAILHAVVPHMIVRIAGIMLTVGIAAAVSQLWNGISPLADLVIPLCLYTLAVSAAALLLAAIVPDPSALRIYTFFILIAAFALCPIYIDAALFFPAIRYIRLLLPPYWLWMWAENITSAWLLAAAIPLSVTAIFVRFRHRQPQ